MITSEQIKREWKQEKGWYQNPDTKRWLSIGNWASIGNGASIGNRQDCYKMQGETPGWNSDTYWPPEAIAIIKRRIEMEKFWMVLVDNTRGCTYKHYSLESARIEAERLLNLPSNYGRGVTILEAVEYGKIKAPVTWDKIYYEGQEI